MWPSKGGFIKRQGWTKIGKSTRATFEETHFSKYDAKWVVPRQSWGGDGRCGVWVTANRATVPRFEVYIGLQHNYDGLLADREIPKVESTHNRTWQRCCSCDVTSMSLATWGHVPATVAHHLRATTRLEAPVGHHVDQSYDSRDVLWFYPT